jgi:hypothetical protein
MNNRTNGLKGLKLEGTFDYDGKLYDYMVICLSMGTSMQQSLVGNIKDETAVADQYRATA